ncbi:MAG: sterol desaturase family protein [Bacteroidota bacterium]
MIESFISYLLYQASYWEVYAWVFGYFVLLYFVLAPLFLAACRLLHRLGYLEKIVDKSVSRSQIFFEIKHSFVSLLIFGFSAWPIIYLVRADVIHLLPNTIWIVLLGLVILTAWNEVHFYLVHRWMHTPFFMKRVHYVHHKYRIPTVYSVYSFHWLESTLLSTVPLTITPFLPFSPLAIFLFPLVSVLINYSGHCNYRFGKGSGKAWKLFGTNHNHHHSKGKQNFGFASGLLDRLNKEE